MKTYTLITCHFGSEFWVTKCIENVVKYSGNEIKEIFVINQNRDKNPNLKKISNVTEVIEFDLDVNQARKIGHDHPASLDRALNFIDFKTSHIIILDSDCFPISPNWIDQESDIEIASDPNSSGLTHPCFVVIPVRLCKKISFSFGLADAGFDTGRLLGLQLAMAGEFGKIHKSARGFNGIKGTLYSDSKIFHFGSATFRYSKDRVSSGYIGYPKLDDYFIKKIRKNIFKLNLIERFIFSLSLGIMEFKSKLFYTN